MSPGLMHQLGKLVEVLERGSTGVEYSRQDWDKKKYQALRRAPRRCRILVEKGLALSARPVQTGYEAFRVSPRGLALWDRHLLEEV